MNSLELWAKRWRIPPEALEDFKVIFGIDEFSMNHNSGEGESMVSSRVRLEASKKGIVLYRNNVGGCTDGKTGRFIRYGLANDSKRLNSKVKSSDLVGIKPIKITEAHIGLVIGQFVSRETKKSDWKWKGDEREMAQLAWHTIINNLGGDSKFCNGPGSF